MKKVVAFMHVSLDGYAAGPNGEMDWIKVDEEMFDYVATLISESEIALYGRVTYELMENYWPTAADQPDATKHDIEHAKWYKKVKKAIVSKTMKDVKLPNTTIISDNFSEKIKALKQETENDIILFGSPSVARALTAENLIEVYWLFINPILLGKGKKIFDVIGAPIPLRLLTSKTFDSGVICLQYEVNNSK
ncbi:MAG: dihydrofolate reductase family protein, partial [Bacteroidales bacterium]